MSLIRTRCSTALSTVIGLRSLFPARARIYLPRSLFKCFAIYGRNLVPNCRDCNEFQEDARRGDDKRFIHPYFDEIPSVLQFLRATVHLQGGALRVEFAIVGVHGLDEDLRARLDHQLETSETQRTFSTRT